MEKKLSDYLHLYLGQPCKWKVLGDDEWAVNDSAVDLVVLGRVYDRQPFVIAPILRPLSDMTEEEMKELLCLDFAPSDDVFRNMVTEFKFDVNEPQRRTKRGTGVGFSVFKDGSHYMSGTLSFVDLNPHQFVYLLKLGFDLFGLIEAGLAIDKSKLTTPLSI